MYGLNDASRKFWLKVKEVFSESRMERLQGDGVFYYQHNGKGDLEGMILSHVDDFILAGMREFMEEIMRKVKEKLDIYKLEDDIFRFNGIDVFKKENRVVKSMEEYARSLEKLNIRNGRLEEELARAELMVYRKPIGKFSCLASNKRPYLAVYIMESARKQKKGTS